MNANTEHRDRPVYDRSAGWEGHMSAEPADRAACPPSAGDELRPGVEPPSLGILADDLAGVLASASRLEGRFRTQVLWKPTEISTATEAVLVDMQTRDRSLEPRRTSRVWTEFLEASGCKKIELRIDSTLRGQPAEELAGVIEGSSLSDPLVLAMPAFPEAGRVTVDGVQRADAGPGGGPLRVSVGKILFPDQRFVSIGLNTLSLGVSAVVGTIQAAAGQGERRFVLDATESAHLATAAGAVEMLTGGGHPILTVSPGAWLRYLERPSRVVLVVVSSATPQNRSQLATFAADPMTHVIDACASPQIDPIPSRCSAVVVETTRACHADVEARYAYDAARCAVQVLRVLQRDKRPVSGIVVTGGHAASCLVEELGAHSLRPTTEIAPLCGSGHLVGGPWSNLRIVTKGGLIGKRSTLAAIARGLLEGQFQVSLDEDLG